VAGILDELRLPAAEVVSVAEVPSAVAAAERAAARLPAPAVVGELGLGEEPMPALTSAFSGSRPGPAPTEAVPVTSTPVTAPWRAVAVFVGVVGLIVVGLVVVVVRGRHVDPDPVPIGPVLPPTTVRAAPTEPPSTASARPLQLGFVTQRTDDAAGPARAAVDEVNVGGGALGHDVNLLTGASPDAVPAADALITDVTGAALDAVVAATGSRAPGTQDELAVCAIAGAPTTVPVGRTVLAGDPRACVEVLVLAALRAGDPDPTAVAQTAREVLGSGPACLSMAQCRGRVERNQIPSYRVPGRTIRLISNPDSTR
jgi:hypothetical protein